jgi:predicted phage terminase large subunit-like protein
MLKAPTELDETPSLELDSARALAEAEMARRQLASRHLLDFTRFSFPSYKPDPFHAHLASYLDRVVSGDVQRLMIFAPPQHGKSELVSIRLPPFWLGRRPDDPVILTSYGGSLAFRNSRASRSVLESEEFRKVFDGVRTDPDSRAVDRWSLYGHRGFVVAAGVGGPITGHGAGLGIIDDPVASWAQAQSRTYRDSVYEWFRGTFRTRIWEGGAIVLIMTRWHEDDLAGRLLHDDPTTWTVLRYPATSEGPDRDLLEREYGEPLSPSRYSKEALASLKNDAGPSVWMAEYQGTPTPPDGSFFDANEINFIKEPPTEVEAAVRYWDLAATEEKMGRDPDYTVGFLMAKKDNRYICIDAVRGRWSPVQVEEEVFRTSLRDNTRYMGRYKVRIEEEPGASGKSLVSHYTSVLAGFDVAGAKASGSKMIRAQPFSAQVSNKVVDVVIANWNDPFLDEMRYFPVGAHEDMIDAASGAFTELAMGPKWRSLKFLHLGMK